MSAEDAREEQLSLDPLIAPPQAPTAIETDDPRLGFGGIGQAEASRRGTEALRRKAEERKATQAAIDAEGTELTRLRLIAARQREIALGKAKGSTPAQETQAAKALLDLEERMRELEDAEEDAVDWDGLTPARRDAMRLVLRASDEQLQAVHDLFTPSE